MTETPTPTRDAGQRVAAVLVSHDGERWLPEVLDALESQTRPADLLVAADTGSTDESLALVSERLGTACVVSLPRETPFGVAVQAALDDLAVAPVPPEIDESA